MAVVNNQVEWCLSVIDVCSLIFICEITRYTNPIAGSVDDIRVIYVYRSIELSNMAEKTASSHSRFLRPLLYTPIPISRCINQRFNTPINNTIPIPITIYLPLLCLNLLCVNLVL